ncbi:transposase [Candidatus Nomurabacteria bacterium]|nr:transposase [Candidatus Nomurabacteria bacterium]
MLRKDPFITGEYYHIYNRGIDKRTIFKSKKDYERFIMLLYVTNSNSENPLRLDNLINQQHKTFNEIFILDKGQPLVSIGAWCLMTNHFHLLIRQEIDGGISKFMKKLGTGYSMFFNIKYQRKGALFGGPFKSKLIGTDDNYMRQLFGYIHINPLEIAFPDWKNNISKQSSEMKNFLDSYEYSSYVDHIGQDRIVKNIINKDKFPNYFHKEKSFQDFVENYFIKPDLQT